MACRKNSIDNEQDNIICFATFVVTLHRQEPINVLILKTIFKPIKNF